MWDSRSAALHAMTTGVVACILLLHLPNTARAADAPVRLPDELQQTVAASRDAWRTQRRSSKSLPQVAEHVYDWIEAAAPKSSVAALVDALAKVMVVRGEEASTGWTQRWQEREHLFNAEPIFLTTSAWTRGDLNLLAIIASFSQPIDSFAGELHQSLSPLILAARGEVGLQVTRFSRVDPDASTLDGYACLGFVDPTVGGAWPDVLIAATGGDSHGAALYQLHANPDWKVIWTDTWMFVADVDVRTTEHKLIVSWWAERGSDKLTRDRLQLRYRESPVAGGGGS